MVKCPKIPIGTPLNLSDSSFSPCCPSASNICVFPIPSSRSSKLCFTADFGFCYRWIQRVVSFDVVRFRSVWLSRLMLWRTMA
ncbi:hypothetical protein L1987_50537 [Smallanthus sonchifolius]|uniref:Uncharacterized protein n=1 Tax=Smallanthus sonchifolius TaxID=185202 RepID=A0ACB9EN85_9ASTR|nr:hypothetical protein L1987_50537 [Smallanthus sonchifolius]